MNPAPHSGREKEIFEQALDFTSAEARLGYLKGACGGDAALLARVETLLRAHDTGGGFLPDASPSTVLFAAGESGEKIGTIIGRYRLLEKIGEGGFGVVYMAAQEEPVRRRVALKVIKLGMDTREIVARFEAERQALAMMDHPNIAKVLDGGATETGRPYFVMELVKGVPITAYCDQRQLSTAARLELFVLVCQAVQHAHQKGIIHRDLKPSNILVTELDDRPVPKVIDFGVARATQARLTEKTMFTQFHQLIGTPAYMSPEQTGLGSLDIDTRSDIYSLGVLLYELLTGGTPFDAKTLLEAGYEGIMRTIREVEPPKPSTRLGTLTAEQLVHLGAQRHEDPRRLGRRVQGDLDWIVMRSLEKDRKRRYETASDFAGDLRRHLGHEPVVARPPSNLYRFRKFVRRHRVGSVVAATICFALVAGFSVARWQKWRADQIAAKNWHLAEFLKTMLQDVGPSVVKGRDPQMMKDLLDETARRARRDLADQPEVHTELCDMLGDVYWAFGDAANTEAMYREALAVQRTLHRADAPEVVLQEDALAGFLSAWSFHLDELEALRREELAYAQQHPRDDRLIIALFQLADAQLKQGKYPAAATNVKAALSNRDASRQPGRNTAWWLAGFHEVVAESGDPAGAEAMCREALAIRRQLPFYREQEMDTAWSLLSVGAILLAHGEYRDAETTLREALQIQRKHPGIFDGSSATLGVLEEVLTKRSAPAPAEALAREQLAAVLKTRPASDDVFAAHRNLAMVLKARGDLAGAEAEQRAGLGSIRALVGPDNIIYALQLPTLASILQARGDYTQAEAVSREALTILQHSLGEGNPRTTAALNALASVQTARGDFLQAIATRRLVLEILQKHLSPNHPLMTQCLTNLAGDLTAHGDFAEAETRLKEAWRVEQGLNYFRMDEQRELHENFARLYATWTKSDPTKAALAAEWQRKLEAFNATAREKAAALQTSL